MHNLSIVDPRFLLSPMSKPAENCAEATEDLRCALFIFRAGVDTCINTTGSSTDAATGILWLEGFSSMTAADKNTPILLFDGHSAHRIIYPAHTIHIWQPLDDTIFAVIEAQWSFQRKKVRLCQVYLQAPVQLGRRRISLYLTKNVVNK